MRARAKADEGVDGGAHAVGVAGTGADAAGRVTGIGLFCIDIGLFCIDIGLFCLVAAGRATGNAIAGPRAYAAGTAGVHRRRQA